MKKTKDNKKLDYSGKVKTPRLARLMDKPLIYIAFALVALVALGSFMKSSWDSFQNATAEPEVISPYLEVQPVSFQGKTWASEMIKKKPEGVSKWGSTDTAKPQSPINPKICNQLQETPQTLLSTHVAEGSGVETRIQVYGAGQAAEQFTKYTENLKNCSTVKEDKTSKSKVSQFSNGFILTVGDVIVGVTSKDTSKIDSLIDFYVKNVEKTLKDTKCLDLSTKPEDRKRSFYYDEKSYEGLYESKDISTNVNFSNLPEPTQIKLKSITNPSAVKPEGPLPEDLPELPDAVESPTIPEGVKSISKFEDTATYLVPDDAGPGCGWVWSAQQIPVYDRDALENSKNEEISGVQNYVDRKAKDYIESKNSWALSVMSLMPKADNWNTFVKQTDAVHQKWDWLRNERNKIRYKWFNYIDDHNSWLSFDDRKAAALQDYEDKVQKCEAENAKVEQWESEWREKYNDQEKRRKEWLEKKREASASPSPSPTQAPDDSEDDDESVESPTPTPSETPSPTPSETFEEIDIPQRPLGCNSTPERPWIIDQEKPAEPQAPKIPEGVTIPDSWPKI